MTSSMESRLSQRNTQVVELQKEITEKSNHVTTLEREVCVYLYLSDKANVIIMWT